MPLPSLLRASAAMLSITGVGAVVLVALAWNVDRAGALVASLLMFSFLGLAELQAAWRLNRALARFAAALPGEPVPSVGWGGEQGLAWPDLGVRVEGYVLRFTVRDLAVEAGGEAWIASSWRAAEAGRAAAARVGLAPPPGRWDGALPGPGAVRAPLGIAIVLGPPAVALWVTGQPLLATFLTLLAIGGGVAYAVGVTRHRATVRGFLEGLRAGNVEIAQVDLLATDLVWRWAAYTSAGLVEVDGVALPHAPFLWARASALKAKVPVAEARHAGQDLAERLRS